MQSVLSPVRIVREPKTSFKATTKLHWVASKTKQGLGKSLLEKLGKESDGAASFCGPVVTVYGRMTAQGFKPTDCGTVFGPSIRSSEAEFEINSPEKDTDDSSASHKSMNHTTNGLPDIRQLANG